MQPGGAAKRPCAKLYSAAAPMLPFAGSLRGPDGYGQRPARLCNAAHGLFGRNPKGTWLKQRHSLLHS